MNLSRGIDPYRGNVNGPALVSGKGMPIKDCGPG